MARLTRIKLENFTAFNKLDLQFSPGVNVIIGENGTGKTHLIKLLYAATAISTGEDKEKGFARKLAGVFNPYQGRMTRLIRRQRGLPAAKISIKRDDQVWLTAEINNQTADVDDVLVRAEKRWKSKKMDCAYIPVKEMLAHAPGFLATAAKREIAFEDVYVDLVKRAFLPMLRGPLEEKRRRLLDTLQKVIEGKVVTKADHFFLKNNQGELEFSLLAEGMRKLALIWLLIQNGILLSGSVLFWDEPEANLNPSLMGELVEIILELQRLGVQIFLASHNYVLLKEFDLRCKSSDEILYVSLFREGHGPILARSSRDFSNIEPNAVVDTFNSLYDRHIARSLRNSNG